jgi:hypothetical protein
MNTASGTQSSSSHPMIYAFSVPLYPGCTVQSVSLPDDAILGSDFGSREGNVSEIHLFSMGTRDTTTGTVEANGTTTALSAPNTWAGAWASDTEGNYNLESGNFDDQSFRSLLQPSVAGQTVRIKLDNALGTSPMDIGMVQHSWATDAYEYVAPIGSGDHTADPAATEYTASGAQNDTSTGPGHQPRRRDPGHAHPGRTRRQPHHRIPPIACSTTPPTISPSRRAAVISAAGSRAAEII